ncbi:MAG: hypothetical protein P4L51_23560 [Puia sp.]|nr:hypothetical protein [Puia sp.]
MKKAKFMLIALALFGVVGGALAFKAERFSTYYLYTKNGSICEEVATTRFNPTAVGGTTYHSVFTTSLQPTVGETTATSVCTIASLEVKAE